MNCASPIFVGLASLAVTFLYTSWILQIRVFVVPSHILRRQCNFGSGSAHLPEKRVISGGGGDLELIIEPRSSFNDDPISFPPLRFFPGTGSSPGLVARPRFFSSVNTFTWPHSNDPGCRNGITWTHRQDVPLCQELNGWSILKLDTRLFVQEIPKIWWRVIMQRGVHQLFMNQPMHCSLQYLFTKESR